MNLRRENSIRRFLDEYHDAQILSLMSTYSTVPRLSSDGVDEYWKIGDSLEESSAVGRTTDRWNFENDVTAILIKINNDDDKISSGVIYSLF